MLIFMMGMSVLVYLMGLMSFCLKRKHLLLMLLSLEVVVLGLYFFLYFFLIFFDYEFFFCMIFLTMSVCEGVVGLSILISLVRTHSGDYFQSLNVLW
uniref:NADH-ubiquinone oxidoreductase chain 4L n=1 Tax=Himaloaesalus gaoligongshanus TaxID=2583518 RepID=A0A7L4VSY5_9SCAR|nr:NADH dehydrogenase subunit 4L [Himaloaesalus gaoligongshanus]QCU46388.1 NADH dehydrogenase subunit 4L [Himaloaesalus gaoligongshanus]WQF69243.1 NADH dehydrogenase subunit 4L [Himaloaesalus gaoligongshanus]